MPFEGTDVDELRVELNDAAVVSGGGCGTEGVVAGAETAGDGNAKLEDGEGMMGLGGFESDLEGARSWASEGLGEADCEL